jgi:hypothetical protein
VEKSFNWGFYLPSRDVDDMADINQISNNFRIIDDVMYTRGEADTHNAILEEKIQEVESASLNVADGVDILFNTTDNLKEDKINEDYAKQIFASAIKNTASGSAVALTDISPIKHELKVKCKGYVISDMSRTQDDVNADVNAVFTIHNLVVFGSWIESLIGDLGEETFNVTLMRTAFATENFITVIIGNKRWEYNYASNSYLKANCGFTFDYTDSDDIVSLNISAMDLSTVTLQSFEKNLYDNSTIANKLDVTAHETSYKKYKIILPNGTYTWSLQENTFFGTGHYLLFTDYKEFDGTPAPTNYISSWIGHNGSESLCQKRDTFEVTRGYVYLSSTAPLDFLTEIVDKLSTMQIESGTEATPFEPYKEPTPYSINTNGMVDGVTSVYPTTTLIPDTEGVVIDAEYNADTKKYIDNKFAELAAMLLNS